MSGEKNRTLIVIFYSLSQTRPVTNTVDTYTVRSGNIFFMRKPYARISTENRGQIGRKDGADKTS